jgi:D-3-phosphoglycerate dehydrogenase
MKIVIIEPLGVKEEKLADILDKLNGKDCEIVKYTDRKEDSETLIERAKDADVVILTNLPFRKEVIEQCKNLKMISVAFTGVDHVDVAYCKERGITVCNAAGYSTNGVAELTFGLAISVYRDLKISDATVRASKGRGALLGRELNGKKFGIVGTGAIGMRVAEIAKAFGCEILAYSRTQKDEFLKLGAKYLSLDELMAESDIVSLHLPLNEHTKGLIGKEEIAKMKESAILINTARGPIVDSEALAEALNNDKIAGAGIDVFEVEPPIPSTHPLVDAKNTILAPHIAFATEEALLIRADIVVENIVKWIDGNPQNLIK